MGNLFTNFTKIMKNRELNHEGVGLGLTISKNLAKALGGDIYVQSEIGVGSSFTLKIPVIFVSERMDRGENIDEENIETQSVARFEENSFHEELKFGRNATSPQFTMHYSFGITPPRRAAIGSKKSN